MKQVIWVFGGAAVLILLILLLARYSLLISQWSVEWMLVTLAILFTMVGVWLSRKLQKERSSLQERDASENALRSGISPREYEVLVELGKGFSNREIADRLYISETTVKTHVSSLFRKLDVQRRTQLLKVARDRGLLS